MARSVLQRVDLFCALSQVIIVRVPIVGRGIRARSEPCYHLPIMLDRGELDMFYGARYVNNIRYEPLSTHTCKQRRRAPRKLMMVPRDTDDAYTRRWRVVLHSQ